MTQANLQNEVAIVAQDIEKIHMNLEVNDRAIKAL